MSIDGINGEDQRSSGPEDVDPEISAFDCWMNFTYIDISMLMRNRPLPSLIDLQEIVNDCYIETFPQRQDLILIAFDIETTNTDAGKEARNGIRKINRRVFDRERRGRRIKSKDGDSSAEGDPGQQGRPARTTALPDKHLGDDAADLPARDDQQDYIDLIDMIDALDVALREHHPDARQMLLENAQGISVRAIAEVRRISYGTARGIVDHAKERIESFLKDYKPVNSARQQAR